MTGPNSVIWLSRCSMDGRIATAWPPRRTRMRRSRPKRREARTWMTSRRKYPLYVNCFLFPVTLLPFPAKKQPSPDAAGSNNIVVLYNICCFYSPTWSICIGGTKISFEVPAVSQRRLHRKSSLDSLQLSTSYNSAVI